MVNWFNQQILTWSITYSNDRIDVFDNNGFKGSYNLIPETSCNVCSYPLLDELECPWKKYHPKFIQKIYSIGTYRSIANFHALGDSDFLSQHIYFLKNNPQKAEPLGLSIAGCAEQRYKELLEFDHLIAIPQHESELHKAEFGGEDFNPADVLAEQVNSVLKIPIISPLEKTRPQSMQGLGLKERQEVVKDLYVCKPIKLQGKRVILIDDVSTSGSTLDKCAEELKKCGAEEVVAFVCGTNYLELDT